MKTTCLLLPCLVMNCLIEPWAATERDAAPGDPGLAAQAINALALELLAKGTAADANALVSPYSIQTALAMAYAGAEGDTRREMARVLHYAGDEAALHRSFAALRQALDAVTRRTMASLVDSRKWGGASEPILLTTANRLFGQEGYDFRTPFLALVKDQYGAPLQPVDFRRDPEAATRAINGWVDEQTRQRIRDLVPPKSLSPDTRLVLVNAVYLKAPWAAEFVASSTQQRPFHLKNGSKRDVPTMLRRSQFGYRRGDGYSVVAVPYTGGDLQFLVLLPDGSEGLAGLEAKGSSELLAACASVPPTDVLLYLPKFKLEPPLIRLGQVLQSLGMRSAFDVPPGAANFDRMARRKPNEYLFISEVFHKTFLAVDERGTEAAAATAVAMAPASAVAGERPKPVEVRVDRPFLFAIQHVPSGAWLFVGRVTDPR